MPNEQAHHLNNMRRRQVKCLRRFFIPACHYRNNRRGQ
jgi:hypothetical protein